MQEIEQQITPSTIEKDNRFLFALDITILIVFACICLQVLICIAAMLENNTTVYSVKNGVFEHIDFINTYMMGKLSLSSESHKIYDAATQLIWYNKVIAPAHTDVCTYFQYPPFYYPLFSPLSFLSLREAFLTWNALTIAIGSLSLFLAGRAGSGLSARYSLLIILGAMASFPSSDCARDGQLSWILVALISLFYYGLVRKLDFAAGIALGVTTLKPHLFVMLLIPAVISKRHKLLISGLLTIAALLTLATFSVGWENVLGYPNILLHAESTNVTNNLYPERMVCLRGLASQFLSRSGALAFALVGFALGLVGTAILWWRAFKQKKLSASWAMALSVLIFLITSPHLLVYDCVLISVAAMTTLPTVRPTQLFRLSPISHKLWCLLLCAYPILSWLIMLLVPYVGRALAPMWLQECTAVNGLRCGLMSYHAFFACHCLILACGLKYALSHDFAATRVD